MKGKAKTKAFIKNMKTGVMHEFPFNPSQLSDSHDVIYKENTAPGSPHPRTQFVAGTSKTFEVELFLYDRKGLSVREVVAWLQDFLPWTSLPYFNKPPTMLFAFGWYVKECVMENISVTYLEFDNSLNPTMGTVKLSLRTVWQ